MSDISNYLSINQNRIEALYTMVVVSAWINDLSDRLANGDVIYRRNIFLQFKANIIKIKTSDIPVVLPQLFPKNSKNVHRNFQEGPFSTPRPLLLTSSTSFEAVVDVVNPTKFLLKC